MNLKNIERKDGWITYYYTFDYGYGYDFMIKYIESILKIDQFKVDRLLKAEMANSPSVNCTEEFFKVNDIRKMLALKDECGRITLSGFSKKLNYLPIKISLYNQTNYLKIEHPEMNMMPSKDEITEYVSYIGGQAMNDKNEFKKMSIEDLEEYLKKENEVVSANYLKAKYMLGMKYWRKDRMEEGIKLLNEIKEYCEDNPNSKFINANAYLGRIYYFGVCVEKDYIKARQYLEECLKENDIDAIYLLGLIYYKGKGIDKDYIKARECFEKCAKENDIDAMNYLGVIYYNGQGVEKNYIKARECFKKCAKENDILAIYYLGRMYYYGEGIDKDYKKAKEYFEECAKENDIYAIYYLGRMYYYGEGVDKDYKKAREYFERCSNENHISGTHYLGLIYYLGKGIEEDYKKAKECFAKGADNGNLDSKYHLAQILYEEKKYKEARMIFEELAEKDDVEAIYYLGMIYYFGKDVEKDYNKAKEYFMKCCNIKVHIGAIYCLGTMAYKGYGMKQDYLLAKESFEICSEKGHVGAMYFLGDMYSTGKGVERDMVKAKEYFERCAEKNHLTSIYDLGLMYFCGEGVEKKLEKAKEYFEICVKENDIDLIINIAKLYEKEKNVLEADYYFGVVEKKVLYIVFNMMQILINHDVKEENNLYKTKIEKTLLKIINTFNKDDEWIIMNDSGKLEYTSILKFIDEKLLNDYNQICDLNSKDYKIIKDRLTKKLNKYLESKKIEEKDLENTKNIINDIINGKI